MCKNASSIIDTLQQYAHVTRSGAPIVNSFGRATPKESATEDTEERQR